MPVRRYVGWLVAIALVVLILYAGGALSGGEPPAPGLQSATKSLGDSGSTAAMADGPAERSILRRIRIITVDQNDKPVPGAHLSYLLDGSQQSVLTGPDGDVLLAIRVGMELAVEKPGYLSRTVAVSGDSEQMVTLTQCIQLTVSVKNESGGGVVGAGVCLADRWLGLGEVRAQADGTTDENGELTLHKAPGKYFLHVVHQKLIYQRKAADAVVELKASTRISVQMVTPYVVSFVVSGGNLLTFRSWTVAGHFGVAEDPVSVDCLKEMAREMDQRNPGSHTNLWLVRDSASRNMDCNLQMWFVGRRPLTKTLRPVRFDQFVEPYQIDCTEATPSDEFGACMLQLFSTNGVDLSREKCSLQKLLEPRESNPIRLEVRIVQGELATLPCGKYRLRIPDEPFLEQEFAARGPIVIEKGAFVEAKLISQFDLVRTSFRVTQDGAACVSSFGFMCRHVSTDRRAGVFCADPTRAIELWVPAGSVECSMGRGGKLSTPVLVNVAAAPGGSSCTLAVDIRDT